jgi:hypothetical protein
LRPSDVTVPFPLKNAISHERTQGRCICLHMRDVHGLLCGIYTTRNGHSATYRGRFREGVNPVLQFWETEMVLEKRISVRFI